jgi:hypothetical protein
VTRDEDDRQRPVRSVHFVLQFETVNAGQSNVQYKAGAALRVRTALKELVRGSEGFNAISSGAYQAR